MERRQFTGAALLALQAGITGCIGTGGAVTSHDTSTSRGGSNSSVTETTQTGIKYPPGVSSEGVTDSHALSAAHNTALADETFTVETVGTRSVPTATAPTVDQQSLAVAVDSDHDRFVGRFRRDDADWEPEIVQPNFSTNTDLYSDGKTVWFVESSTDNSEYRSRPLSRRRFDFTRLGQIQTAFDGAEVRGTKRFEGETLLWLDRRFTNSVLPEDGPDSIRHHGLVDGDGRFRTMETITRRSSDDTERTVRLRHAFRRIGRTEVTRPNWVEEAAATA
jgi:hypothetical protein